MDTINQYLDQADPACALLLIAVVALWGTLKRERAGRIEDFKRAAKARRTINGG